MDYCNKVILVTSIGSVAGRCVIDKLRGLCCTVVGTDIYPREWVVNAMGVDRFYQVEKTLNREAYWKQIIEICRQCKVDYIIPLTDVDVDFFNDTSDAFKEIGITVCISDCETIKTVRNKKLFESFVKDNERFIKAIPTREIGEGPDDAWKYPIVCKPTSGRSSQGLRILDSYADYIYFAGKEEYKEHILEPFINGTICVADLVFQKELDECVVVLRKELIRTVHGCGTTVEIFRDDRMEMACVELARKLGIKGCVNFELIMDCNDQIWVLECNPRFSAGVAFSCMSGYDFVGNALRCFNGLPIDNNVCVKEQIIARRYEEFGGKIYESSDRKCP